jgi:hypothetical protein
MNEFAPGRTMPAELAQYKVSLPCRRRRSAAIRHYRIGVRQADAINWQTILHNDDRAWSYPGRYTGIEIDGIMYASDEAKEIVDYLPFLRRAQGRVLLTGLGLGLCLQALLRKPEIEHVTVIEDNVDVLTIVAPYYLDKFGDARMSLIHADAFGWQVPAGMHFDLGYHDIWPVATGFYWPQHAALFDHYEHVCSEQDSWRRDWMRDRWQQFKQVAA